MAEILKRGTWENIWGYDYNSKNEAEFTNDFLARLEKEGKIGDVVVDIGSGAHPLSDIIKRERVKSRMRELREEERPPEVKAITVDIAGDRRAPGHLKYDVDNLKGEKLYSTNKAILKVCRELGIDPRTDTDPEKVDTIVLSKILCYVDYQSIIPALAKYLKINGRFIIINNGDKGYKKLMAPGGVKSNDELLSFLEGLGLEIEEKDYPYQEEDGKKSDTVVLLAKKTK